MFIELDEIDGISSNLFSDILTASSIELQTACIELAVAEMKGYLGDTYDVAAVFESTGTDRHPDVLTYCSYMAIYRMNILLGDHVPEMLQGFYDEAVTWLDDVSMGIISPDLPFRNNPEPRFLTEDDYDTLILDEDKDLVSNSNQANRFRAEDMAIDQMKGFLRAKYDVVAAFAAGVNPSRSKVLVMYCMDIALYHLHASIPGRFVPEIRRIRYEDALAWLRDVAKGLIDPDLPLITDPITGDLVTGPAIVFGSNAKQDNSW